MADSQKKIILFIDDDEDDFLLLRDIFEECRDDIDLQWVKDSEQAIDRLTRSGADRPSFILLDLNMPKLNGHEVLAQIRQRDALRDVPVAVLTNSINRNEVQEAYRLGVNSFLRKPSGYTELREFAKTFCRYWFDYSTLS